MKPTDTLAALVAAGVPEPMARRMLEQVEADPAAAAQFAALLSAPLPAEAAGAMVPAELAQLSATDQAALSKQLEQLTDFECGLSSWGIDLMAGEKG